MDDVHILCRDLMRTTERGVSECPNLTYRQLSVFVRVVQTLIKPFSELFSRPWVMALTQFITMLFGKDDLSPRTSFGFQTCGIPLERVLGL